MPERLLDAVLPERGPTRDAVGGGASVSLSDVDVINPPGSVERLLYDARTTTPEYFMGVIPESHETVRAALVESQFARSYVTYPKVLTDESGGVKRKAASVWVYRPWPLSHFQFHIPLFDVPGEDAVYVYYHHEYNWLRHPLEHLDAEYLNPRFERDRVVSLFESAGLTLRTAE